MSYRNATPVQREHRDNSRLTPARLASACLVAGAHIAFIGWLADREIATRRPKITAEPMVAEIFSATRSETPVEGVRFIPLEQPVELAVPELPVSSQPEMTVDAPRIDPSFSVDIASYSARANLSPGVIATILMLLEISPDGSVVSAQIIRSSAGDAANAAAMQYAQATRWMPGKVDGEPRVMQASLTVILGERG
jgi:hypothetical protein